MPTGGRVGSVDATAKLNGYVELIEMDAPAEQAFTRCYAAALKWDGSEPLRPFG